MRDSRGSSLRRSSRRFGERGSQLQSFALEEGVFVRLATYEIDDHLGSILFRKQKFNEQTLLEYYSLPDLPLNRLVPKCSVCSQGQLWGSRRLLYRIG